MKMKIILLLVILIFSFGCNLSGNCSRIPGKEEFVSKYMKDYEEYNIDALDYQLDRISMHRCAGNVYDADIEDGPCISGPEPACKDYWFNIPRLIEHALTLEVIKDVNGEKVNSGDVVQDIKEKKFYVVATIRYPFLSPTGYADFFDIESVNASEFKANFRKLSSEELVSLKSVPHNLVDMYGERLEIADWVCSSPDGIPYIIQEFDPDFDPLELSVFRPFGGSNEVTLLITWQQRHNWDYATVYEISHYYRKCSDDELRIYNETKRLFKFTYPNKEKPLGTISLDKANFTLCRGNQLQIVNGYIDCQQHFVCCITRWDNYYYCHYDHNVTDNICIRKEGT